MLVTCERMAREIFDHECSEIILETESGRDLQTCQSCGYGKTLVSQCPIRPWKAANKEYCPEAQAGRNAKFLRIVMIFS